jgi:hypothetical protein
MQHVCYWRQGLKDLGYVEDRDFHITYRSSDGYQDRLPALAEELVRLNPDVLIGAGLDAVVALRNVTQTIPIVSATLADAVHLGLIANEARPTGNVTGIEPYVAGLPAKQMEFAREIMPGASKMGLLTNLSDPKAPPQAACHRDNIACTPSKTASRRDWQVLCQPIGDCNRYAFCGVCDPTLSVSPDTICLAFGRIEAVALHFAVEQLAVNAEESRRLCPIAGGFSRARGGSASPRGARWQRADLRPASRSHRAPWAASRR